MSTIPQTPPATTLEQQIQQATNTTPLEIRLETGEHYTGATPQELLDKLAAGKTEASKTIKAEREQRHALERQIAELQQRIPAAPASEPSAATEQYYQTWAKDPEAAFKMQLGTVLGVDPAQAVQILQRTIGQSSVQSASDEFTMRCPDYPGTPEAGQMMREAMAKRFGNSPVAVTADNLELTFNQLVREGKMTPAHQQAAATAGVAPPNPVLRGTSVPPSQEADLLRQAREMPLDKLRELLQRNR